MRVEDMSGAQLDEWVAKAMGVHQHLLGIPAGRPPFAPSTEWGIGGPIVEREKISIEHGSGSSTQEPWRASIATADGVERACGSSALVAAMRVFVMSKAGRVVS